MPIRFLHSPVTLRTRRSCFLSHSDLGKGFSYAYPVPALTIDPAYPAILFSVIGDAVGWPIPSGTDQCTSQ